MGSFPTLKSYRAPDPPRRISTYMNLDKVHRKNTSEKFDPIDSFAYVVLQLKNDDPRRKMYEDDRMYYSREGAIYPDDRHFLVTKEVCPGPGIPSVLFATHGFLGRSRHPRSYNSEIWTTRWNGAKSKVLSHPATCPTTLPRTSTTPERWMCGCWTTLANSPDTSVGTVLPIGSRS